MKDPKQIEKFWLEVTVEDLSVRMQRMQSFQDAFVDSDIKEAYSNIKAYLNDARNLLLSRINQIECEEGGRDEEDCFDLFQED